MARIEPMSAVWTTTTSPARSAKKPMKSSGRLPSADCTTPVVACPRRGPRWSVAAPTRNASAERATAETAKTRVELAPASCSTAVASVAAVAMAAIARVPRPIR